MNASGDTVAPGDTVLLHYQLSSGDDAVLESTFGAEPIELTLGRGDLAWNLERCLIGLAPGERHVFLLEPAQAFGHYTEALVQRLPLSDFPADMALAPRMLIEFSLPNGSSMPGTIQAIGQDEVVVDFNHPLSDCPVNFEVEVLRITRAAAPRPSGSH